MPPGRTSNLHAERDPACPPTDSSLGPRKHAYQTRPLAKRRAVIHTQARLRLPLMDHLVQHRMLHFRPGMAGEMAAADGDLDRPSGSEIHAQLAEPSAHSLGDPEWKHAEGAAEVLVVESLVELLESVQKEQVTRLGPVVTRGRLAGRLVLLDRKRQELSLGESSKRTRNSGIQKTNDGTQDTVRAVDARGNRSASPAPTTVS